MSARFIGAGWAFPLRTDATGSIALVTEDREIAEAIWLVLATSPGERPMRPEFGSRLADYVFAPANAATAGLMASEVRAALERWEPRIDVGDVDIGFGNAEPEMGNPAPGVHREQPGVEKTERGAPKAQAGIAYITVHYEIRGTNDPRNLVFPFYLIPDEQPGELAAAYGSS
jgi:phage baseplate assembly protein W